METKMLHWTSGAACHDYIRNENIRGYPLWENRKRGVFDRIDMQFALTHLIKLIGTSKYMENNQKKKSIEIIIA